MIKLGKKASSIFSKDINDIITGKMYYYNSREQEID